MNNQKEKNPKSIDPRAIAAKALNEHNANLALEKKREKKGELPYQKFKKIVGGESNPIQKPS